MLARLRSIFGASHPMSIFRLESVDSGLPGTLAGVPAAVRGAQPGRRGTGSRLFDYRLPQRGTFGLGGMSSLLGQEAIPPLYACVMTLARMAAGLPMVVSRNANPYDPVDGSALAYLLRKPSPLVPRTRLWLSVFIQLFAEGQAFVYIRRNEWAIRWSWFRRGTFARTSTALWTW